MEGITATNSKTLFLSLQNVWLIHFQLEFPAGGQTISGPVGSSL